VPDFWAAPTPTPKKHGPPLPHGLVPFITSWQLNLLFAGITAVMGITTRLYNEKMGWFKKTNKNHKKILSRARCASPTAFS